MEKKEFYFKKHLILLKNMRSKAVSKVGSLLRNPNDIILSITELVHPDKLDKEFTSSASKCEGLKVSEKSIEDVYEYFDLYEKVIRMIISDLDAEAMIYFRTPTCITPFLLIFQITMDL